MDFRGQAPSAPSGFLVVSPFYPAGMLVDFDRGAVQHQRCFVHQILLNLGYEDIFPYASFCPGTEPAVHTLPWPEPLRQIPPWYSGVQPIQDCVEHFPVAFSRPASLRLFFRRKQTLDPIPLFFTYFMSFHVLYFTILALYTQYLSFKTGARLSSSSVVKWVYEVLISFPPVMVYMVTLHFTGSWLCLHLSTLLSGSVPSFEPLTLALMVAGGILGGTVRRLLNRRLGNRAVDKLFIALMVVIICISAYPIISGSMPAFRRGCCRAISTRPQSTLLKIKAVPPDPCQAQVRRHCFVCKNLYSQLSSACEAGSKSEGGLSGPALRPG